MNDFYLNKWRWILCLAVGLSVVSCADDGGNGEGAPHDPSKPIVLTDFYPQSGPIATQVILSGENFGNSTDNVRVWFNDTEAAVVQARGDHMLVLAPRRPGEECEIRVEIDGESTSFGDDKFDYIIQTSVSTLVGGNKATSNTSGTVSLANAQFKDKTERSLAADADGNVFFVLSGKENEDDDQETVYYFVANEEEDMVKFIRGEHIIVTNSIVANNTVDGHVYTVYTNTGNHGMRYFDTNAEFSMVSVGDIGWGSQTISSGGMPSWGARTSMAMRPSDGKFYFRSGEAILARFDPATAVGEVLKSQFVTNGGGTDGIAFDKTNDNIIYFTAADKHCVYKYNIATEELGIFAGTEGQSGYVDGEPLTAKFNRPRGLVIDSEGDLIIADTDNHCIRRISMSTGYVSTMAGQPGQPGLTNGIAEISRFNKPMILAITPDDIIYIGDSENYAIRRLAIE